MTSLANNVIKIPEVSNSKMWGEHFEVEVIERSTTLEKLVVILGEPDAAFTNDEDSLF